MLRLLRVEIVEGGEGLIVEVLRVGGVL